MAKKRKFVKPAHRDDLDNDVLDSLEKEFPGFKIVCAGDLPGPIPPAVQAMLDELEAKFESSLRDGTCVDCGKVMPAYPPTDDPSWKPTKGWVWFSGPDGRFQSWQCPECDKTDGCDNKDGCGEVDG